LRLNAVRCSIKAPWWQHDKPSRRFKCRLGEEVRACRWRVCCRPLNFQTSKRFSKDTADKVGPLLDSAVLIIEVTNARDVVRQRIGRLGERLIGKVVDPEAQVEKALIQEMETAFRDFGIEARILSVQGPQLVGRQHLELPIQVREDRDVRLSDE
jgi:hypothetical protein